MWVLVEAGSRITSPKELEAQRKYREAQQEIAQKKMFHEAMVREARKMGPHYTVVFDRGLPLSLLDNATLARFFYLVSYMGYDSRLMTTKRRPMTKSGAQRIMNLPPATFYRFWNEIEQKQFVQIQPNGEIRVCAPMFHRGNVSVTGYSRGWIRIYQRIRELYESLKASQHRYIGAVLRMIPYVNIEYNILCYNPLEIDIQAVEPMSMEDFCQEIGMAARNAEYYRKQYERIRFNTSQGEAGFCKSVFTSDGHEFIYINPEVLFAGQVSSRVEMLSLYFRNQGNLNFLHDLD